METTRTILSKPIPSDFEGILSLYVNPSVRAFLGGTISRLDFEKKFKQIITAPASEFYWIVKEKENQIFIGLVSLTEHHDKDKMEVSYQFLPECWGKGYGTETVRKVIEYGFKTLQLKEIVAETQKRNKSSIRLLEKVGMQFYQELERFGEQQVIYSIELT